MRKKIFVYSAFGVLCAAGILTGCKNQEPSNPGVEEVQTEAARTEDEVQVEEVQENETVSEPAVDAGEALEEETSAEEAEAEEQKELLLEKQKREEEFRKTVDAVSQSYKKLEESVDVASLETEKGWEYSYFSPMLAYYGELAMEGFDALTEEEIARAESGILEVKQAIEEWK